MDYLASSPIVSELNDHPGAAVLLILLITGILTFSPFAREKAKIRLAALAWTVAGVGGAVFTAWVLLTTYLP